MPALVAGYRRAAAVYRQAKAAELTLDYDDLEQGALELLEHEDVRSAWQGRVDAVLVDEFQDTNHRQRAIVRHLCGTPGELFVVGDAKQSIYRFRGADVVVFRQERRRIAREGTARVLATTYRAHPPLLEALNALLTPVLGEAEDPMRPWAEPFQRLEAVAREPLLPGRDSYVEMHLALGSKGDGALDRAADAIVQRLIALVEGGDSPLGYGDVAILCRASSAFESYENALERAGVPFLTVSGKGFYQRPEVRSLLTMLRASWNPDDDVALMGTLRSPVIGLSDAALYRLSRGKRDDYAEASWWAYLRSGDVPRLSLEQEVLEHGKALLEKWQQLAGRTHVADLLQRILIDAHYQAALIAAGETRAARNVTKLLTDARVSELVGVGEFLEYVANLRDVGAREGEARPTAEGVVQLMTVHAAKGLEFPVVVLGDLAHAGRGTSGLLLDDELGPVCKVGGFDDPPSVYALAKEREADQDDAEDRRLLYVAATRAQELLLLNGTLTISKNGKPKLDGWLGLLGDEDNLGLAGRNLSEAAETDEWHTMLHADQEPVYCAVYGPDWEPTLHTSGAPDATSRHVPQRAMLEAVEGFGAHVDDKTAQRETEPPRMVWRVVPDEPSDYAPAWLVGTLVHEALADRRALDEAFDAWAESRAASLGLIDKASQSFARRRCKRLMARFLTHPLWQELQGAQQVFHEVPYARMAEGTMERGAIDILYQLDDAWHVLDIKTDHVESRQEARATMREQGYDKQLRRYGGAVHELLGVTPMLRLVFLDCAGRVEELPIHPQAREDA
ncbi:MAG: UvrD-helicase domain-containing protein [Anaerolineae bacterium]